ncbi:trypsin-like peptidase domain-containing protein, partial [Kocuria sp. NPDC057446]|uniref:trypsin-like peptidase domain-containing protein n=1 Tax=Kocuria sp. NPDC057446 TaxID=3346137 RepID=UPI003691F096
MDSQRIAFIAYQHPDDREGEYSIGSGLLIGQGLVLTADHVANGAHHRVAVLGQGFKAEVAVRSHEPSVDLAVLRLCDYPKESPSFTSHYARVGRETLAEITGCRSVGFPRLKKDKTGARRGVQVTGTVPTFEGTVVAQDGVLVPGVLTLKITDATARDAPSDVPEPSSRRRAKGLVSPWGGMSGAAVFTANDNILGVIRHHNYTEGTAALALTPISDIERLPSEISERFRAALGLPRTDDMLTVPDEGPLLRDQFLVLLNNKDYQVFEGRQHVNDVIETFLASSGGIMAVTAPAGVGKTALLAHLVRSSPDRYAYHFFTGRYDTGKWIGETNFLKSILQQLDPVHAKGLWDEQDPSRLRARFRAHLAPSRPPPTKCILLDGLDEIQGWDPRDYLGAHVPPGTHVIVSIRDTGQNWRSQYGIAHADQLPLEGLDRNTVSAIFAATGQHAAQLIQEPEALDTVVSKAAYMPADTENFTGPPVHGADPFYVRLLAEDAEAHHYTLDQLKNEPAGLTGYLDEWWEALRALAKGKSIGRLFELMTAAKGPLSRTDLVALLPDLFDDPWATDTFDDDVLPSIRRFVSGNDEGGYSLAHPRLGNHLAHGVLASRLNDAQKYLLEYCEDWHQNSSQYALSYLPLHFADTKNHELPHLYSDMPYLEEVIIEQGVDRLTRTMRTVLQGTKLPDHVTDALYSLLRLFELEAPRLRQPYPIGTAGYVARQLALQSLAVNNHDLLHRAQLKLVGLHSGQLVPRWTTERTDSALRFFLNDLMGSRKLLAVAGDGHRAFTACRDGSLRMWDLGTGQQEHIVKGHATETVTMTRDGSQAMTGSRDGTLRLWNFRTGSTTQILQAHSGRVLAVHLSDDGSRAVSVGSDETVRLWDLKTGQQLHVVRGHSTETVAMIPDGSRAVIARRDGTLWMLAIWDLTTGQQEHIPEVHRRAVRAVAITPDGSRAVTGSEDGTARVWDL